LLRDWPHWCVSTGRGHLCYCAAMRLRRHWVGLSIVLVAGCQLVFSSKQPNATTADAMPDASSVDVGCSDGTREGFASLTLFPRLAGCEGAWAIAGMRWSPGCDRKNGNNINPSGVGCAAADLCAPGWAVCSSRNEIATRLGAGSCENATTDPNTFFATSVGSVPSFGWKCDDQTNSTDDLYGCGTSGNSFVPSAPNVVNTCLPLTKSSDNDCSSLDRAFWRCSGSSTMEQLNVTKLQGAGGVLCCKQ